MRNLLILGALILVAAAPVRAQDYPKAEVFGGYQYIRLNPGGANCQGIGGSAAGNLNNWFGVVGDFGYCRVTGLPSGTSAHAVNYLFGPRVTYRSYGKLTPFGHVLFGGQHFGVTGGGTANAFAMALGGGAEPTLAAHGRIMPGSKPGLSTAGAEGNSTNLAMVPALNGGALRHTPLFPAANRLSRFLASQLQNHP